MNCCNMFNNFMSGFIRGMNFNAFYGNPFACNNLMSFGFNNSVFNSFYNSSFLNPYQYNMFSLPIFTMPNASFNSLFNVNQTNLFNSVSKPTLSNDNDNSNISNTSSSSTKNTTIKKPNKKLQQKTSTKNNNTDDDIVITTDIKDLKAKWKKKNGNLSDAFYQKVINIAEKIKCSPNDLMALMYSESGLKSTAVNKSSKATGLIQFMPKTAESLGTSVEKLKSMSPEKQLDYVEKYFVQAKKYAGFNDNQKIDAGTLYSLCFLPARSKREVLCYKGEKYYTYNAVLDKNKDGKITKSELGDRLIQYYA